MTHPAVRVGLVAVAAAGAFFAGRAWPRPAASRAPAAAAAAPTPPTPHDVAVAGAPPRSRGPAPPQFVAGIEVPDDLARTARDNPEAVGRLRSHVVIALDARRRQRNAALRLCLDTGALVEATQIRFSVEVNTRAHRIDVGPVVMAEVIEGPGLTDATLTCLIAALDQRETIDLPPDQVIVPYDGPIEVPIRFAPARPRPVQGDATGAAR